MNTDIRVSVSFKGHRKRKKLRLLVGDGSTDYLLDLWISTAMNHPDGILVGMDDIDIALEAGWEKYPKIFVEGLLSAGFLEKGEDGVYFLHDWEDHQGFVVHAKERSEKARNASRKRWENRSDATSKKTDAASIEKNAKGNAKTRFSDPPSPTPNPSPTPLVLKVPIGTLSSTLDGQKVDDTESSKTDKTDPSKKNGIPYAEIIGFLNSQAGTEFNTSTKSTKRYIKARFAEGFTLEDFRNVISSKVAEWKIDERMCGFLRPQTLFSSNFEAYLQVAKRKGNQQNPAEKKTDYSALKVGTKVKICDIEHQIEEGFTIRGKNGKTIFPEGIIKKMYREGKLQVIETYGG